MINNRMAKKISGGFRRNNERKCPHCGSGDVKDTGSRGSLYAYELDGTKLPEPTIPVYRCNICGRPFLVVASGLDKLAKN